MMDRFNRVFLRTLRALGDLRRRGGVLESGRTFQLHSPYPERWRETAL